MFAGFTSNFDVGALCIWLFWLFFFGLVIYLRMEDKREGYPLDSDRTDLSGGKVKVVGFPFLAKPKAFRLEHDDKIIYKPTAEAPRTNLKAKMGQHLGAPIEPIGDPMLAEVGPGSYAMREEKPDTTVDGADKIAPMHVATDFSIAKGDPDPRGFTVVGVDEVEAGTITEVWVDRSEPQIRYLQLTVKETGDEVLLPINFCRFRKSKKQIKVHALPARYFKSVPKLKSLDRITLREEDKVCAFYGAGKLYGDKIMFEPLI